MEAHRVDVRLRHPDDWRRCEGNEATGASAAEASPRPSRTQIGEAEHLTHTAPVDTAYELVHEIRVVRSPSSLVISAHRHAPATAATSCFWRSPSGFNPTGR